MPKIHSHYENLKVSRNAPPEIIRAAYKLLSQKYHPDKYNQNPEYARIMVIINTSYKVLIDPIQRKVHDSWILEQEKLLTQKQNLKDFSNSAQGNNAKYPYGSTSSSAKKNLQSLNNKRISSKKIVSLIFVAVLIIFFIMMIGSTQTSYKKPGYQNSVKGASTAQGYPSKLIPSSTTSGYMRPLKAPNGLPWPIKANYLDGYEIKNNRGLSSITIDNSRGSSDVYFKLASISGKEERHLFIPRGEAFAMENVDAGKYKLKYKLLDNGSIYKVDKILLLEEVYTDYGTRYSNVKYTLYEVPHGNMTRTRISEEEF